MADIAGYQDKLKDNQDQQGQTTDPNQISGASSDVVGAGSGAASTAGIGAGGTGGWTNIQAYLGANKQDTGSSDLLKNAVDSTYNKEKDSLDSSANDSASKAQAETGKIQTARDNAKTNINQAATQYNYQGPQSQDYYNTIGNVRNAMTSQYSGPNDFAYQKSAEFQKNQSALSDPNAFNSYMGELYRQKAGGQLNSGQEALQNQLDVNNENLAKTKADVMGKYAGFDPYMNQRVTDTNSAIQNARNQYGTIQNGLKDDVNRYGNDYQTAESKAEADARAAYDKAYNAPSANPIATSDGRTHYSPSFNAMQRDYDNLKGSSPYFRRSEADILSGAEDDGAEGRWARTVKPSLDNFYAEQDNKYKDTGDTEKRNWNAIQDILGSNAAKYNSGFKVRG